MTPLEAMAAALEPHVWDNDPDIERFCLRALRTLKASGYELVPCETDAERIARVKGNAETRPAEAGDPLAFLKARQKALSEEFHALGDDARRRGVEHPGVKDTEE